VNLSVAALLLIPTLVITWYITLDTAAIRNGTFLQSCSLGFLQCSGRLAIFYVLEVLPLAALCLLLPNRPLGVAAALTLLVLPFFVYGPSNDLVMRGSFPAIIIAALGLVSWLDAQKKQSRRLLAYGLLAVAGFAAASELWRGIRGFDQPAWQPMGVLESFEKYFPYNNNDGYPPHYLIPKDKACTGYRSAILKGCP